MTISVRRTGRLAPPDLADLVQRDEAIHGESGFRRWEFPTFADYGRNYILEAGGDFAGSAQLIRTWDDPSTAYLAGFGLTEGYQGRGLGGRFLAMLLDELAADEVSAVELSAAPGNAPAVRMYENAGFQIIENQAGRYGPGEDRLIMRLELRGEDKS